MSKNNLESFKYYNFKPEESTFNPDNALVLAKLASLIYKENEIANLVLSELWGMESFKLIEGDESHPGTQVYICANADQIFITFRASQATKPDWSSKVNFNLVSFQKGKVHQQLYKSLQSVWQRILESLLSLRDNRQGIYLCGHSSGGGLAHLAAHLFLEKDIPLKGVYTFGQPRVGDEDFAKNIPKELAEVYFRVVNENDYIGFAPPKWMGYAHSGNLISLGPEGKVNEVPKDNNSFWQDTWSLGLNFFNWGEEGFAEHDPELYIQRLADMLQSSKTEE